MHPQPGQLINNKYRLARLIGEGGMGSVWETSHELLGTSVALKFLHGQLAKRAGLVERFLQEAQVSARIKSPHVVTVSDVDQTADGLAFMVMELIDGQSLQGLYEALFAKGERLGYGAAFEIMLQIIEGVSAAHRMGIVHRDLKPDNVMLTRDAKGRMQVKILDFGIAKLKASGELERGLTRPGVVMGTPEYMAPEQAFSADKVDGRADVFSLGVMFFEMLSGHRPVGGDSAHAIAAHYLEGKVANLHELEPTIPDELSAAVHTAMGATPDERFDNLDAFRSALEPFAPEAARAPSGHTGMDPIAATKSRSASAAGAPTASALTPANSFPGGSVLPSAPQVEAVAPVGARVPTPASVVDAAAEAHVRPGGTQLGAAQPFRSTERALPMGMGVGVEPGAAMGAGSYPAPHGGAGAHGLVQPMGMQPMGMQPMGMQPMGMQPMGMQPMGMQPMGPGPRPPKRGMPLGGILVIAALFTGAILGGMYYLQHREGGDEAPTKKPQPVTQAGAEPSPSNETAQPGGEIPTSEVTPPSTEPTPIGNPRAGTPGTVTTAATRPTAAPTVTGTPTATSTTTTPATPTSPRPSDPWVLPTVLPTFPGLPPGFPTIPGLSFPGAPAPQPEATPATTPTTPPASTGRRFPRIRVP